MRLEKLVLVVVCLVWQVAKSQQKAGDSIYNCNVKLIHNCDTLRALMQGKHEVPKINYNKMLKRDKKVIAFLNAYHADTLSLNGLNHILGKVNAYNLRSYQRGDTVNYSGTISEKGLTHIYLRYSYLQSQNRLISRFYDLQINNEEYGFDRPFDYHYKIFRLVDFCLGRRFSCYNFDETF